MKSKNKATENDFIVKSEAQGKEKEAKKVKKDKSGKKPNIKRMGAKIKDVFSELKKVTWPTFPKVVKQTGVVLLVVVCFLVVITAFDFGLFKLLGLVSGGAS